ncbi:MAG: lipopolysaccharide 1,6-galactosyltransferase [Symbiopectobacterium sp.]|uniref:lipopolysaccharide 1,6-galactosyltransferase n=1 Tax=Symbiopectobacterium sp. TaxID=2952789 RepID=UPI0039EAFF03
MNILFVGEAISGFGGIETVLKKVTHFLTNDKEASNNYTLYFLCRDDRMEKNWLQGLNVVCHHSGIKISFFRRMSYVCALAKFIVQNQPDIVIAFDSPSCRFSSLAIKKSNSKVPVVSWVHYSLDHKKHSKQVLLANYHLAISSGIKQQLLERGVSADRIALIFNPISRVTQVIPRPDNSQPAVFIYVGRLKFEGQKRIKDMLDAFSGLNQKWECHFIGDGSDRLKCQEYAHKQGVDENVHWHGWQNNPWGYIQNNIPAVTALLLTSSFEGFGMVLAEAMSFGIYCVSSDCPSGPADIIKNNINGTLFKPMDYVELQSILKNIIDRNIHTPPNEIKHSISNLYDDVYYKNLKSTLIRIKNNKKLENSL